MRKTCLIIFVALGICSNAAADSGQRETVEALLVASGTDRTLDAMYDQFDGLFANMSQQLHIKESEQAGFQEHIKKVNELLRDEMNWDTLKEPMIDLYMTYYTEQELQDMLAFYESETGQSMVKKMPEVMAASMQITQGLMKDIYPKIIEMSQQYSQELKSSRASN